MGVNAEVERRLRAVRVVLDQTVDSTTRTMMGAWVEAWAELAAEWQLVAEELTQLAADGKWPTKKQIGKARRVVPAMRHTAARLDALIEQAGATMSGRLEDLLGMVDDWERGVVAAQLPNQRVPSTLVWDRISPDAINRIVTRTTEQFYSVARPIRDQQLQMLRQAMIRGVALGENSGDVAERLLGELGGVFDGGAYRVEVITRTEMLDAYRDAARLSREAGKDVIAGWEWVCDRSARTCGVCLAMDGQRFPVSQPGPWDHVCGRCTAASVTLSWRDLGIDLDEPVMGRQVGRDYFDTLSVAQQEKTLGKERLRRLRGGEITWDDVPRLNQNPAWRPSYGMAPLGGAGV